MIQSHLLWKETWTFLEFIPVFTSLSLNQKLDIINLREEGISKTKISQKLVLLCQIVSQGMNEKEKFLQ